MSDADPELFAVFRDEVSDAIEEISSRLALIEGADDDEADALLEAILRSVHNVKGAARFAGSEPIELLAHAIEDRLSSARGGGVPVDEALLVLLRRSLRRIGDVLEGSAEPAELLHLAAELSGGALSGPAADELAGEPVDAGPALAGGRDLATVRVDAKRIERLMSMTGELFAVRARFGDRHQRLTAFCDALRDTRRAGEAEARASVESVVREMESLLDRDRHELQRLGFFAEEFGESVKRIRMQPLGGAVPGLARAIGNLAEDLGKQVRFTADVGDIEIDRQILDALRDPLLHLLRNAIDHGLEPGPERAAAGKDPTGAIRLSARSAGSMVEIDIADDGRGIDVEAVARRAVRDGVAEAEHVAAMDAERLMDLVFSPGVSTATEVSRVSGRGVGLDVVRSRVTQLGGRVHVSSSRDGTTFHLVVPATAVSTTGLVVRCGEVAYALPIAHVVRTIRVPSSEVRTADGGAAIERSDGEPLRLRWLASLMSLPRKEDPPHLTVVIVSHLGAQLGLVVGSLVGEMQFVSKRLPWNIERAPAVAGAVVSGDGSVALVVDVPQLFVASHRRRAAEEAAVRPAAEGRRIRVLVVDDSLTSRTLERNILTAAGYEVEVAVDGEAAWRLLQASSFDLVVSDVQMPKLDGIGLTRRIRSQPATERLPVILVTSLDRPEDLAAGAEAGADEYIVKGQFDQRKLLEAVARHT